MACEGSTLVLRGQACVGPAAAGLDLVAECGRHYTFGECRGCRAATLGSTWFDPGGIDLEILPI